MPIYGHKRKGREAGRSPLGVMSFGALLLAFSFEAVSTGADPRPRWETFGALVVAPLIGFVYPVARLFGPPRPAEKNVTSEV